MALELLAEGMGMNAVSRVTKLHVATITKALLIAGDKCQRFMNERVQGLSVAAAEIDELWQFVGCKERNRANTKLKNYAGDCWTFFGIDADTKLILAHESGRRTKETATTFLGKLRRAIAGRCQITSDALPSYKHGVPFAFLSDVDYSVIIKRYKSNNDVSHRYSPAGINSTERIAQFGNPDMARCSTSYIERFNLSARTGMARFQRLSLKFSKSVDVHLAMISIWVCCYNFSRKHATLKQTPAMAAGITEKALTIREMVEAV
jgi:IS1 family transposase